MTALLLSLELARVLKIVNRAHFPHVLGSFFSRVVTSDPALLRLNHKQKTKQTKQKNNIQ
jgi:hypothetical protein